MPMVNLPKCLNKPEIETGGKIIVCELNNYFVGFKVGEVSRIYRISWAQMEPAPAIVGSDYVIGIVKMDNRLIVLLDFEKILAELNPEINAKMTVVPEVTSDMFEQRKTKTLLIAEDSVADGCVGQRIAAILASCGQLPQQLILKNLGKTFAPAGSVSELEHCFGLDADSIAAAVREANNHGK